jgi:antitoxin component YwqK of YwqJK toxin-antitoxin module
MIMQHTKFFIILLILIYNNSFSQTEIPVQSTWILKDDYGRKYDSKITKERYKTNTNGNIEGLFISYDEDGKTINNKITYKDGVKNGPAFESLGVLYSATGNYLKGNRVGEWSTVLLGGSFTIDNYIGGKIEGKSITYTDNSKSKIQSTTEYKNGLKQGAYISYFENGTIKEKGNYENDIKVGEWTEYLQDEVINEYIIVKGLYINGKRDKIWTNYGILYPYLDPYVGALKKAYEPGKGQYGSSNYGGSVDFVGGNDMNFGAKKNYNSEFDNGKFIKENKILTRADSIRLQAQEEAQKQKQLEIENKKKLDAEIKVSADKADQLYKTYLSIFIETKNTIFVDANNNRITKETYPKGEFIAKKSKQIVSGKIEEIKVEYDKNIKLDRIIELNSTLEKMIQIGQRDCKELNKKLKNVESKDEIKNILGL